MPTKPQIRVLTATAPEILNTIRNSATQNYKNYIPYATPDAESIKAIGSVMMQYAPLQNEFLTALVNRIGRVIITSKLYSNPWSFIKRGYLEFGETMEEIFVNLAKPFQFDPAVAEETVWRREIPDVKAAFHTLNYQKFYKATIQNVQLRQAFLSWEGITDLIARIVDAMYTGANYDEFLTMKYLLARHIVDGHLTPVEIAPITPDNGKSIVTTIKAISNSLEFMDSQYNMAGVSTYTRKADQFLFVNAKFDAMIDVEVLASAFNMDKAEFMGRRVLVDSFGALDEDRLNILFKNEPNYTPFTDDELAALDAIPAILVDRDFLMIYDNFQNFTELYNGEGLYWNYWYHVWKTFSVSPFHNAILFTAGAPSVTSVAVTPATATAAPGQTVQLNATVETTNFAPKSVKWWMNPNINGASINQQGLVTFETNANGGPYIFKAYSTFDETKNANSTITVTRG